VPAGGLAQLHSGDHYRGDHCCGSSDRSLEIEILAKKHKRIYLLVLKIL
jgi:hypothetical protein